MTKVRESLEKINLRRIPRFDEPLAAHCTFKVGGPADCFAEPSDAEELLRLLQWARSEKIPFFVLGGGANVLFSDRGYRGLVIETSALSGMEFSFPDPGGDGSVPGDSVVVKVEAGLPVSEASARAADRGLAGLDFIYSMPGSVGGAVFMNARCYGSEIGDILVDVDYVDENLKPSVYVPKPGEFLYKDTPFQKNPWIITAARLRLSRGDRDELWSRMRGFESDRRSKGHFAAPCAGSVFKNDHSFGEPSGKIIDSLGMRGETLGGAQISAQHANIIINTGTARAQDIRGLMTRIQERVLAERGFPLEPEVLLIGDWS